jgi:hypothetical protein
MPREVYSSAPPRQRRRVFRDPRRTVAIGAMAGALILPPQLLGGVDGWAIALTAGLALLALATAHIAIGRAVPLDHRQPLVVVMAVALAWTAIQAFPLPCGMVEALAPPVAAHVSANRALLDDPALGACTLSWAPGASRWELAKGVGIAAAFLSAWMLSIAGMRRQVLMAAGASAVAMALVGLAHLGTGAEQVFGLYEPKHAMPRPVLAPLLNPNQLSGFLAMGVPVLAGLGLHSDNPGRRALWMVGAVLCGIVVILSLSRGGMASLLAGLVFLAALAWTRRRSQRGRSGNAILWVGGAVALIVAAGAYLALDRVAREFADGDLSKLELIGRAALFGLERPWIGVGRGAFGAAFAQAGGLAEYRADHAENTFVQWAVEWGLPVTLALLVALALSLRSALGESRSPARAGALAAVGSIVVHDLTDFSLELTGVAVVAAAVLGAAVATRRPRRRLQAAEPVPWRRSMLPWLVGGGALLLGLLPTLAHGSVPSLQEELLAALHQGDRERFREDLRGALALHPSEPAFPLLAATEAVRHGDPRAPRWINRAIETAPDWPAPRLVAAEWLWAQGARPQAMLEVREAARLSPGATRQFLCHALRGEDDAGSLLERGAPEGIMRAPFLEVAASCLGPRSPAAGEVDALLLATAPDALPPRLRRIRRLLRSRDLEEAHTQALEAARQHPQESQVLHVLAEVQVELGNPAAALETLEKAEAVPGDRRALLRARAEAFAALGDHDAMGETLQELRGFAGGSPEQVAKALSFEGGLWERHGHPAQALRAFDEAHRVAPRRDRLERVAESALALGDRGRAFRTYLELCQTYPEVERFCRQEQRLRRSLDKGAPVPLENAQ